EPLPRTLSTRRLARATVAAVRGALRRAAAPARGRAPAGNPPDHVGLPRIARSKAVARLPAQEVAMSSKDETNEHETLRALGDEHFTVGLRADREARLRAHLPTCPSCRAAYQAYQIAERLDPA